MDSTKQIKDVLVIGGGPGGTPGAMALAAAGKVVMLVEAGRGLGGTCLFEGCIPSKIFRETAARRDEIGRARNFGLSTGTNDFPAVNWSAVQERRHQILTMRAQGALGNSARLSSLEVVFGRARLTSPRSAVVECADGPRREVTFEQALLATGSIPNRLPIPGADLPGVLDSEGLIEIGFVPGTLTLIGGGPIGVEMAQIFFKLGSRVTLIEEGPRILAPVDEALAKRLQDRLVAEGIEIHTNAKVESIEGDEECHRVSFQKADGSNAEVASQTVVLVTGRHPNIAGLGLETTAVAHDAHGVKVDGTLQTDQPGIYATGDIVGHPMFAHWATAQSLAVAEHLLGRPVAWPRPETNSAVIFSFPEIGMVGLTEEAARAAGIDVRVAQYDYRIDARAQISGEAEGLLRMVYREDDRRIVGVHVMIEGAADLMGEAALAVEAGTTLEQMARAIHPHPTLTEAFGLAARGALASLAAEARKQ